MAQLDSSRCVRTVRMRTHTHCAYCAHTVRSVRTQRIVRTQSVRIVRMHVRTVRTHSVRTHAYAPGRFQLSPQWNISHIYRVA